MSDIRSTLQHATQQLNGLNADARLEAEILLSHVLAKNRAYLFAYPEEMLTQKQFAAYQQLVNQRVQGTPVAYLTQQREFWSLSLKVNPHTLIPRPETERLVELTLEFITKADACVLDLGTGSGAIALALASERPNWHIIACDYSEEALKIAKENAADLELENVTFYHSDWFKNLPEKRYDAIISNPPYIAPQDPHLHQGDVRFEPLSALVSSQDGLADLHYIINHSYERLQPNGLLLLEHGYVQKLAVSAIFNESGYTNVQCWQDMQGHDRVSGGWRPNNSAD